MVLVTKRAAEVMSATRAQADPEPDQMVRLVVTPEGGFRLRLDREQQGDKVVKVEGEKILVLASDTAEALSGAVIDAPDTGEGPKLTIRR